MGLAEEEGADLGRVLEEGGGLAQGIFDGSHQRVDAETLSVRVHHQAEGGGCAGIAGYGDGDDAVFL